MADVRVPRNVESITFVTSGVKAPDAAGLVTGITANEATELCLERTRPSLIQANSGPGEIRLPSVITSITINSVVYTPTAGVITNVPAIQLTQFLRANQGPFLVIG